MKNPINKNTIPTKDGDKLKDLIYQALTTGILVATVDSHSRLILSTPRDFVPKNTVDIAFNGVDFITLDKDDARAVVECIEESIPKIGGDGATDIEVFGDKAISFERLYDRHSGLIYNNDNLPDGKID